MTFTSLKLRIAVRILIWGMLAGLSYHIFQGQVLGKSYPYNTFLFLPQIRFTDFFDVLRSASRHDPYSIWSLYFPFTYVVFHPLSALPWSIVLIAFFAAVLTGLWCWFFRTLRMVLHSIGNAAGGATVLLAGAFPVWLCLDRGNIELLLLLLTCCYLGLVRRRQYWASLAFLVPAMCIKFYPAVLLGILCRRGKLKYAVVAGALFVVITFGSLLTFKHTPSENISRWQWQLAKYRRLYLVGDGSMGGSANLWNPAKIAIYSVLNFRAAIVDEPRQATGSSAKTIERALFFYSIFTVGLALAFTWHVSVVETEFWRKIAVLGLFMVMAPPGGADYKLVYVTALLAGFIVVPSRRRADVAVVALLALVLIPKKYWFFPDILTDSGAEDSSIGVLINPMLMLTAAFLLSRDGWRNSTARGRALRWRHTLTAFAWWPPNHPEKRLPITTKVKSSKPE